MRRVRQFGERITNWELMSSNLRPHLVGMPHVQALHDELGALIANAKAIDTEMEAAKGLLRELVRRRQDAQQQGENLRARLSAHLKGSFGYTSEQLIPFGLSPLKRRSRRRRPAEQPPVEPPAGPTPAPAPE